MVNKEAQDRQRGCCYGRRLNWRQRQKFGIAFNSARTAPSIDEIPTRYRTSTTSQVNFIKSRLHHRHALKTTPSSIQFLFVTMNTRSIGGMLFRPASLQRTLQLSANPTCRRAVPISTVQQRSLTTTYKLQFAQTEQRKDDRPKDSPTSPAANPFADLLPTPKSKPQITSEDTSNAIDDLIMGPKVAIRKDTQPNSADVVNNAFARRTFRDWSPQTGIGRQKLSFDDMAMPEEVDAASTAPPTIQQVEDKYPRLNPAYGRTVGLEPKKGRDIVRGLIMLSSMMARNKVRSDMNKQRFHERPGLKRKRLKSERWRARFKVAFQETCARVTELKKKGW